MKISIRMDPDGEGLESLLRWLRSDPEVTADARLEPGYRSIPDAMGGVLQVISVVLPNTTALFNLAIAYSNWRRQRPAAPPVVIVLGDREVTLSGDDQDPVRQITALLDDAHEEDGPVAGE